MAPDDSGPRDLQGELMEARAEVERLAAENEKLRVIVLEAIDRMDSDQFAGFRLRLVAIERGEAGNGTGAGSSR
jgi:hypothetical protein